MCGDVYLVKLTSVGWYLCLVERITPVVAVWELEGPVFIFLLCPLYIIDLLDLKFE